MFALILAWRGTASFARHAILANGALLAAGVALTEFQLVLFFSEGG